MTIFTRALVTCALLTLAATSAHAGGVLSPGKGCGAQIPDGSWKKTCSDYRWWRGTIEDTWKFRAKCKRPAGSRLDLSYECSFVESCNWRLKNDYGILKCE